MFEQNNQQQQPGVVLSIEGSSNSFPPTCTAINPGSPDSMTAFHVPIYPNSGMPYIPSPPTQLPGSPLGLQQMGPPLFSQGFPMPYPVGFPTSYGTFPVTLPMPWNSGSDSQPCEGNAPRTWRKVSKIQMRSNMKTPYTSASRRLPNRYVRHKENCCNSYKRKNGSKVPTSSEGYNSTNTNIEENLHASPDVTTAVSQSNSFNNLIQTAGPEQPLSTSATCTNLSHGPIGAWNNQASRESRESHNNCQEIRVGPNNFPADVSHRNDYTSHSSRHNVEVIDIADENPIVSRACDTLASSATSPPTPRSYPDVLHRESTDPRRRTVVERTSRKSAEAFTSRVQDPLSTAVVTKEVVTRTDQSKNSRKALTDIGANPETGKPICYTANDKRSREIRRRIVCSLCGKIFSTFEERLFHYGKIHHLCLSSLDIHVPLLNTSNPADVEYLKGLGIEKCIPLHRNDSGKELAIPIINVDDKGHLINLLESWNAEDVLDLGPIKGRVYN